MARESRLIVTILIGTATISVGLGAEPRKPSVLWILADQWRGQALGRAGDPDVRTPRLDRLADQGLFFRTAFANTPVCCPARAIMLTGTYPHQNGMVANDLRLRASRTTIAEILRDRGYQTGFIGKWHLDGGPRDPGYVPPGPRRQGFDFWAAAECRHAPFRPIYFRDDPRPIVENRFEAEVWTDRAIEFLRALGDDPFFLVVSMGPPHDPYAAPERFQKMYDPARLSMRPNWREGVRGAGRTEIARYDAAITAADEQIGRILKTLDDLKRDKDTIVFFTSDHGDMLGSQGRRLKRKPWEESIRVPCIIRYPDKIPPGRVSDALISQIDYAPTLLALCGVDVPREMQGTNLADLAIGRTDRGPDEVLFQIFVPFEGDGTARPWRGLRTRRFMYARTEEGPWLLYDLKNDPYELRNLVSDPASAELSKRMDQRLASAMRRVGDSWSFDSSEPVEDNGRLYRFKAFESIEDYLKWAASHPEAATGH